MILENLHNEMSDLFNFVSKYDDVIERSRDISKIRLQNFVHHMMDYTHAKLQGSRMCRTEIIERGPISPPLSLPRASNALGLIGLIIKQTDMIFLGD